MCGVLWFKSGSIYGAGPFSLRLPHAHSYSSILSIELPVVTNPHVIYCRIPPLAQNTK